jgi:hypothetical protein
MVVEMFITDEEQKAIRKKQLQLGLSDEECDNVVSNIMQFWKFSDKQIEFYKYVLKFLEEKGC